MTAACEKCVKELSMKTVYSRSKDNTTLVISAALYLIAKKCGGAEFAQLDLAARVKKKEKGRENEMSNDLL